jgi:hypothetical protein
VVVSQQRIITDPLRFCEDISGVFAPDLCIKKAQWYQPPEFDAQHVGKSANTARATATEKCFTAWRSPLKPLFTVHAGEFLVGCEIERRFRDVNI